MRVIAGVCLEHLLKEALALAYLFSIICQWVRLLDIRFSHDQRTQEESLAEVRLDIVVAHGKADIIRSLVQRTGFLKDKVTQFAKEVFA